MAETVSQESIARLLLTRFLARGFSYPDADLLALLADPATWEQLRAADEALALGIEPLLAEMQSWLEGYDDEEQLRRDLEVEYTHLFIAARPHVPAPPYESAYQGRGLLMGEPVSQVLAAYGEAGLAVHRDYDDLPDHIAAELEFVAYLLQQESETGQTGEWRERRQRFWQEHLLRWGPEFLARVSTAARLPFYRLLADLTGALLRGERGRFPVVAQKS